MSDLLKHKMLQHEETPPHGVWDAITERLDDDIQYTSVAVKMTAYETQPPAEAWNSILSSIETLPAVENGLVVPFRRRNNKIYRLAAAAVVAGLIITAGWWMLNSNNNNQALPVAGDNAATAITPSLNDNTSIGKEGGALPDTPHEGMAFSGKSSIRRLIASNNNRTLKYATAVSYPSYNSEYPIIINSVPIHDENTTVARDRNIQTMNGDYLIISAPNGDRTRISSKFANVIRYLNDDDGGVDSETWKRRFEDWRRKILQSAFIPSSGNFFDIADLKELLEEKQ